MIHHLRTRIVVLHMLSLFSSISGSHRSVSDELYRQTSVWSDDGAKATGPDGDKDSLISELGAALDREKNVLHGILSDAESEEQV
jgi:hypothetical protein